MRSDREDVVMNLPAPGKSNADAERAGREAGLSTATVDSPPRLFQVPAGYPPAIRPAAEDQVASDLVADVVAWYAGALPSPALLGFLDELRRRRRWLACGCRGQATLWPMLHPRRLAAGTLTLVRMPDRAPHHPDCPFHAEPVSPARAEGQVATPIAEPLPERGFALLPAARSSTAVSAPGSPSTPSERPRLPRLARALLTLLDRSQIPVATPAGPSDISTQYARLEAAVEGLSIDPQGRVPLRWYLRTHPGALPGLLDRLREHAGQWPAGTQPQGLLIAPVLEVLGDALLAGPRSSARPVRVDGEVHRSGGVAGTGPWLGAFVATLVKGEPRVTEATLQPIHSGRWWAPVADDHERQVLEWLLGLQWFWHAKRQVGVTLTRLAFPLQVDGTVYSIALLAPDGRKVMLATQGTAGVLEHRYPSSEVGASALVSVGADVEAEAFRRMLHPMVGAS